MKFRTWSWVALAALALAAACSDGDGNSAAEPDDGRQKPTPTPGSGGAGNEGGGSAGTGALPPASTLLRRAVDCDDLSAALRDELRARLVENLNNDEGVAGDTGAGGSPSSAGGASGNGELPIFTGTNTHVPGVDEPDFVKTDGRYFYLVDGQTLRVVAGYPAADLELIASTAIEGAANELMLADGANEGERLLVVYSLVPGSSVLAQADVEGSARGFTKVSVVRFTTNEPELELVAEYFFEGDFVSARRQSQDVRTLLTLARDLPDLRTYPSPADRQKAELLVLERIQEQDKSVADYSSEEIEELIEETLGEVMAQENEAVIAEVEARSFMPRAYQRRNGQLEDVSLPCDAFYLPELGSLDLAVTFVPQIDLGALDREPAGAALLGSSEILFENANVTIVASPPRHSGDGEAETQLHVFEVGGEPLAYRASGVVPGFVHDQFAIGEQAGTVRVVTSTADRVNHLYTLQADGTTLEVVGDAGEFGADEDVRSVRFVGDTGYVVTFRQVDPLFVFDLSDPTRPEQLGELEIPGFSEYMHPIDDTHLLTIGQGEDWNTVLRLFDVSDRANPSAVFLHEFDYGLESDASVDHRAFTYFAERGLLAVPFSGWDWATYESFSQVALIGVDTSEGFSELGSLDAAPLISTLAQASPTCDAYDLREVARLRRGTFIDETLYGVATGGVVAAPIDEIGTPEGVLGFDREWECEGGGGGQVGGGGGAGDGGQFSEGGAPGIGGQSSEGGAPGGGGVGGS